MSWPDYLAGQRLFVAGVEQSPRRNAWNLASGFSVAFNTSTNMWDITATGGGGSGHTIEDEGTPLTARTSLNFVGVNVSVADSGGKTVVTIDAVSLAGSGVTGTLPVARGGTGLGAVGTALQVLRTNAGATGLEWATPAAGLTTPGGDGFRFTYSTTTTDADPGAGTFRANNATLSSATQLYVDLAEFGATDITAWLDSLDDSVGTIKGRIRLASMADPTKWIVYNLTAWTTATGYRKLTVAYVAGPGGLPTTAGDIFLSFDGHPNVAADGSTIVNTAGTFGVPNDGITYAKIQNVSSTDRLLGRDTAAAGDIEELTVGGGVEFTGAGGIQRSALTGDVTAAAGSNTTAIASGAVTNTHLAGSIALTKLANGTTKGNSPVWNGSSWVEFGVKTRASDLTDANATLAAADGGRAVLPAGTLTANRQGQFSLTGFTDKRLYVVERYDTSAFTYVIKNSLGVTIHTFAASEKAAASFQMTGGELALVGHWPIN